MSTNNSSNTDELPLLTFNSLYNLLREEKKNKSLQKLPQGFYTSLRKFLDEKRKEVKNLKDKEEKRDTLLKEKKVLDNSKKMAEEFLNLRLTKISKIATKNSIFEEEVLSEENIIEEELDYFDNLKDILDKTKGDLLKK